MVQVRKELGEVMLELGLITQQQLKDAATHEASVGQSGWKMLLEQGVLSERDLVRARATQAGMRFADLRNEVATPEALGLVSGDIARPQDDLRDERRIGPGRQRDRLRRLAELPHIGPVGFVVQCQDLEHGRLGARADLADHDRRHCPVVLQDRVGLRKGLKRSRGCDAVEVALRERWLPSGEGQLAADHSGSGLPVGTGERQPTLAEAGDATISERAGRSASVR